MNLSFVEYQCDEETEWKRCYTVHKTRTIALAHGGQGIPCGFKLVAVCGAEQETNTLDLDEPGASEAYGDLVDCKECVSETK